MLPEIYFVTWIKFSNHMASLALVANSLKAMGKFAEILISRIGKYWPYCHRINFAQTRTERD